MLSGGSVNVSSGGVDFAQTVSAGSVLTVLSGGYAGLLAIPGISLPGTVVLSGGLDVLYAGGAENGVVSSGGALELVGAAISAGQVLQGGVQAGTNALSGMTL